MSRAVIKNDDVLVPPVLHVGVKGCYQAEHEVHEVPGVPASVAELEKTQAIL